MYWKDKVAIVTGGSAGFGQSLVRALARAGARVVVAARDRLKLDQTVAEITGAGGQAVGISTDVTNDEQVARLMRDVVDRFGRLDFLANNAGKSTRGLAIETSPEQFQELFALNFLSAVRCTRAAVPHLLQSRGHLVQIGSLASKTVTRFLGAYPASKFPLAAYAQQLRYELGPQGLHVLLVCPGPIARADAGQRYQSEAAGLPESAQRPGGGVRLRGLDADDVAREVLVACERRRAELVLPGKAKWLLALAQLSPRLGDWIVARMTGSGKEASGKEDGSPR